MQRSELKTIVVEALKAHNGKAHLTQVAKYIWENYADELAKSGPLAYTWQYDIRWAATGLRKDGVLAEPDDNKGVWSLLV